MTTVAYLGPEHTNTHLAALKRFGRRARYMHAPTVEDVFSLVERKKAGYGVVPVENSLEGAVTHTLDRFAERASPVSIVGEIELPIRHYLISSQGTNLRQLERVYSHPQALAQCRAWIASHLPRGCELMECSSTAEAVDLIAGTVLVATRGGLSRSVCRAAIGSKEAAKRRGLVARPIAIPGDNKTRFLVLGNGKPAKGGRSKTSIVFGVKDRPGALYDALVPFKYNRINLTKIESRPSKRKAWEYLFFIDIEGHAQDAKVQRALGALKRSTSLLRVLGSYPVAK